MSTLLILLLTAVAVLGVATGGQLRKTRDAYPDHTDYIARYEADLRRNL